MRIENLTTNFSNIGTVVFYKHHKYIPDSIDQIDYTDNYVSDLVKYHGSTNNFPGINFSEYNFSYILKKYKFNNRLLISDLDTESLDMVGKNIDSTNKIGKILFPTLVDEEVTDNSYSFFGSISISGRNLYFLECPEKYQTIEIYEDILVSNILGGNKFTEYKYLKLLGESNIISPAVIIELGPPRDAYNNPTNFYYSRDPLRSRKERVDHNTGEYLEYSALEYSKLCDEIFSKKVISFFLSTSGDILDFNLSFASWDRNDNPARNKWKYEIRNDEFTSLISKPWEITETLGHFEIDKKSGTILGNMEIPSDSCPILYKKLSRLRDTQERYYSPYRTYSRGEETVYKILKPDGTTQSNVYVSLIQGNIGNDPLLSSAWILKDKFLDFVSSIIYISQTPSSCGSIINPGTQITIRRGDPVNFNIIDGLGYIFSGLSVINPTTQEQTDLVSGDNYIYNLVETDTEYLKTVVIDSWSQYLDPESPLYTNNLVFNFSKVPSIIKFLVRRDGVVYHYVDWEHEFGESGFGLEIRLNGILIEPPSSTNEYSDISYDSRDMFLFINNPQENPTLEMTFTGELIKNDIDLKLIRGNRKEFEGIRILDNSASCVIDFSKAEFTINISSITKYINVRAGRHILSNISGLISIRKGESKIISFTVSRNYKPIINLVNFWYNDNNMLVKYENDITLDTVPSEGVLELNGDQAAQINLTQSEDGRYYLSMSDIIENTIVIIEAIKIE